MMGFATAEGTHRYARRSKDFGLSGAAYRELGRTGWLCSVLGFGCYRIDLEHPEHREALKLALQSGCNLVDTSTNYTDGESEHVVGEALAEVTAHNFQREEFIVISKVGYVQGQNLLLAQQREAKGKPYAEMIKYTEDCWHCIHPDFITDQLDYSLERLRMERVDAYLLHNPEYFFSDAEKRKVKTPLPELREQFYARIRAAFERLEEEVDRSRISCYGVSSNTFGGDSQSFDTTSLTKMWEIAEEVAKARGHEPSGHHFSVVQLPLNLFESGPILQKNNGTAQNVTVIEFAKSKQMAVLANRPLNAFVRNQMVRLADFNFSESSTSLADQLAQVSRLEGEFKSTIAPSIQTDQGSPPASDFFRWGEELSNPQLPMLPLEHWNQLESGMIRPQLRYLADQLDNHFASSSPNHWKRWREQYLPELDTLLGLLRNQCSRQSREVSKKVAAKLDPFLPEEWRTETLSRKALAVLTNTPGITCVLNGMRTPTYVRDSLGSAKVKPSLVSPKLYQAFRLGG